MACRPRWQVFANRDIGQATLDLLCQRGYEVEVYEHLEPPPKGEWQSLDMSLKRVWRIAGVDAGPRSSTSHPARNP